MASFALNRPGSHRGHVVARSLPNVDDPLEHARHCVRSPFSRYPRWQLVHSDLPSAEIIPALHRAHLSQRVWLNLPETHKLQAVLNPFSN